MTASTTTDTQLLNIKYSDDDYSLGYPESTTTVSDFIHRFLTEFNLSTNEQLVLCRGNIRLAPTVPLQSFGVKPGEILELKSTKRKKPLTIRIQTLRGSSLHYAMDEYSTMKDLYETIRTSNNPPLVNGTFPILFNHRMVLVESDERLSTYLDLHSFNIRWEGSQIPDFYLFECQSQFQNGYLHYRERNKKELLCNDESWQPASCTRQTNDASSIFVGSLFALTTFFDAQMEHDHNDLNNSHSFHFLRTLRHTLFPPACQALEHLLHGTLHHFEKQLISESFYHLLDLWLPAEIPREQLFLYTPHLLYDSLQKADYTWKEHDNYTTVLLCSLCSQGDTNHAQHTYFKRPISDGDGSTTKFQLYELGGHDPSLLKIAGIPQPDLDALMRWFEASTSIPSELAV